MLQTFPIAMLNVSHAGQNIALDVFANETSHVSGKHHLEAIKKYNILATAKLRIRQSCTKLCRVKTWILCFPLEQEKKE